MEVDRRPMTAHQVTDQTTKGSHGRKHSANLAGRGVREIAPALVVHDAGAGLKAAGGVPSPAGGKAGELATGAGWSGRRPRAVSRDSPSEKKKVLKTSAARNL
jgi:hypothetical protein